MLDIGEVERAIAELENGKTSFATCAKLADLYAIRDHHYNIPDGYNAAYSRAAEPIHAPVQLDKYGDSDFLLAVQGKRPVDVWAIMDDLMDTLASANTRVYDSIMRRIKEL